MILRPQQTKTIARQLGNHLDTNTYYVRAKVRNSLTDELLATVNLTDKGSGRFTGDWLVAQDSTGLGFDVDITTSVYTDSGYTTKSANYADETNEYRVETLQMHHLGGGGGVDINYKKVREIIKEELAKLEMPKMPEIDMTGTEKMLMQIKNRVQSLPDRMPDMDISGLKSEMMAIREVVSREKPEKVNLMPIQEELAILEKQNDEYMENIMAMMDNSEMKAIGKMMKELVEKTTEVLNLKKQIKELITMISDKPFFILNQPAGEQKEEAKKVRLNLPRL